MKLTDDLKRAIKAVTDYWGENSPEHEAIKAALATEGGEAKPIATLHDDGHWTWKGTEPYEARFAGWRMEVYAAPQSQVDSKSAEQDRIDADRWRTAMAEGFISEDDFCKIDAERAND